MENNANDKNAYAKVDSSIYNSIDTSMGNINGTNKKISNNRNNIGWNQLDRVVGANKS